MSRKQKYFAIFAGGGVRGTAYIGALKALNEVNVELTGYASSSVGAVIASLLAVGHSPAELQALLLGVNYQQFRDLHLPFGKDFGFFKGDGLYNWLKENIEAKFYGEDNLCKVKPVTFSDLDKDLIVIATDVSNAGFKEYSRVKTPDVEIAHAVRASVSVPGFFKPVWEQDSCLVDGDVINNFPIWKESSDIIANTNTKILEFRLEGEEQPKEISGFMNYFSAILETSYNISTGILENKFGKNDQFDVIRIDTGRIRIIDFNISNQNKKQLIENGFNSVKKYFNYDLVKKRRAILSIYEKVLAQAKTLREHIIKNKIQDSFVVLGSLSIYFTENKDYIHKNIYCQFLELQNFFMNNVHELKVFKFNIFRNKKDILEKVEKLIVALEELVD
jgi:NTE family protein